MIMMIMITQTRILITMTDFRDDDDDNSKTIMMSDKSDISMTKAIR